MTMVIIKMTAATVIYLIITAIIWKYWSGHEKTRTMKIIVGIVFGLCSIASTHIGIQYDDMILNVRDMGPLAAGLFFDPISGVIAGVIGGVERYLAGTYMGVGQYTTVACSLSTLLAGLLSAALKRFLYIERRPSVPQAFFIGAVMEVFHMYAVLLTHRDDMNMAYYVVKTCSIQMILFNGLGLMGCKIVIDHLSGEKKEIIPLNDLERTPLVMRFCRRLLTVILIMFAISHVLDFNFQKRIALQEAGEYLEVMGKDFQQLYKSNNGDLNQISDSTSYLEIANNDSMAITVFNDDKIVLLSNSLQKGRDNILTDKEYEKFKSQAGKGIYRWEIEHYGGVDSICYTVKLDDHTYLTLSYWYGNVIKSQIDQIYEVLMSDILLFATLYLLIVILVEHLVCNNLKSVNTSLQKIIAGDLNEVVTVRESEEFSLLSDDINQTVTTLKGYIDEAERRMEEELKLAAFIQEQALPHVFTYNRNDFEIYALMRPARQVGGDFYDFFFTDQDKIALVIADVSGKGIPAAMFMMRAKTAIANAARVGKSPSETMFEVNNILCEGNAEMFVTAWLGIIDLETGLMRCANAGHEYPVYYHAGKEYELFKDKHGLVLAAMENSKITEYTIQMEPGDKIFVYTDGVPEAINKKEEQFGTKRLVNKLNTLKDASQEWTLKSTYKGVVEFVGDAEQFDDITMLGFTYNGKPKDDPA